MSIGLNRLDYAPGWHKSGQRSRIRICGLLDLIIDGMRLKGLSGPHDDVGVWRTLTVQDPASKPDLIPLSDGWSRECCVTLNYSASPKFSVLVR